MNCFEWQSRSSDYLDGSLGEPYKTEADRHLDECKQCGERHKRYRLILSSIATQPRSPLPHAMRAAPFSAPLPKTKKGRFPQAQWERIPWYLRTVIEGAGIVFLVLVGISTGPKVRTIYERGVERSLSDFADSLSLGDGLEPQAPTAAPAKGKQLAATSDQQDEFNGEGSDDSSDESDDENVKVGRSEIWRFAIKTDSPSDLQQKVMAALIELNISPKTPGINGTQYPGGIQFDLLLPQEMIPTIKKRLEKLAPHASDEGETGKSFMGQAFSWYKRKNKSRVRIPEGRARVVIWLSQI